MEKWNHAENSMFLSVVSSSDLFLYIIIKMHFMNFYLLCFCVVGQQHYLFTSSVIILCFLIDSSQNIPKGSVESPLMSEERCSRSNMELELV